MGLQHDLKRCARLVEDNGKIEGFKLGKSDLTGIFRIPQKLYGRDNEIKTLLDSFERISEQGKELFMVAGYSGVGKARWFTKSKSRSLQNGAISSKASSTSISATFPTLPGDRLLVAW